jgi:hypothetical protein
MLPDNDLPSGINKREVGPELPKNDGALEFTLILVVNAEVEQQVGDDEFRITSYHVTAVGLVNQMHGVWNGIHLSTHRAHREVRVASSSLGPFRAREIIQEARFSSFD